MIQVGEHIDREEVFQHMKVTSAASSSASRAPTVDGSKKWKGSDVWCCCAADDEYR